MECIINFSWDAEARVWIAMSDDVPGLVLESGSYDALVERVRLAAPELLELNKNYTGPVTLFFTTEQFERMAL